MRVWNKISSIDWRRPGRRTGLALFMTFFVLNLFYRMRLFYDLVHFPLDPKPFFFRRTMPFHSSATATMWRDILFFGAISILFALIFEACHRLFRGKKFATLSLHIFFALLIFGSSIALAANHRMIMVQQSVLDISMAMQSFGGFTLSSFFGLAEPIEIAQFLLAPILYGVLLVLIDLKPRQVGKVSVIVVFVITLLSSLMRESSRALKLSPLLSGNPVTRLFFQTSKAAFNRVKFGSNANASGPAMWPISELNESRPNQSTLEKNADAIKTKRWNIVWFVLESTGTRYIFPTQVGEPPPRPNPSPFLAKLAQNGVLFANNHSSGNSSLRALFTIFTGLYPAASPSVIETRPELNFKSYLNSLPSNYDSFLVTSGNTDYYFPKAAFRSSHLEVTDYRGIPNAGKVGAEYMINELKGVDYFIDRLARAKIPFNALYYTTAPHHPYPDHGPDFHRYPNALGEKASYLNNLYVQDTAIKKVFEQVQKMGLLDSTIFIFAGDHGEAFRQHPDNLYHTKFCFEENLQGPAVFYQPKLFKPRVVTEVTSHADIVPTLLDAMELPFDPASFQGESLFKKELDRRYVFAYGNDNTLASISRDRMKLLISFELFSQGERVESCKKFDLKNDPNEETELACDVKNDPQIKDAVLYIKNQEKFILSRAQKVDVGAAKAH